MCYQRYNFIFTISAFLIDLKHNSYPIKNSTFFRVSPRSLQFQVQNEIQLSGILAKLSRHKNNGRY
jgi:hypothetical protein